MLKNLKNSAIVSVTKHISHSGQIFCEMILVNPKVDHARQKHFEKKCNSQNIDFSPLLRQNFSLLKITHFCRF